MFCVYCVKILIVSFPNDTYNLHTPPIKYYIKPIQLFIFTPFISFVGRRFFFHFNDGGSQYFNGRAEVWVLKLPPKGYWLVLCQRKLMPFAWLFFYKPMIPLLFIYDSVNTTRSLNRIQSVFRLRLRRPFALMNNPQLTSFCTKIRNYYYEQYF